jgi:hypothetical protein
MKVVFYVALICIFFCSCTENTKPPILRVENDSLNIGVVRQGDSARLTYNLHNDGEGILRIISVGTSCGCSEAVIKDSFVMAGKNTIIEVSFYARDTGLFKKHVVAEANTDPIYKTLSFYGRVVSNSEK